MALVDGVTAVEFGTWYTFQIFTVPYRLKKSMNGVYKTNIDCSFIRGMVENHYVLGKIQHLPTIYLGPKGRWIVSQDWILPQGQ